MQAAPPSSAADGSSATARSSSKHLLARPPTRHYCPCRDTWDLSRCSPPAALAWTASRALWSADQVGWHLGPGPLLGSPAMWHACWADSRLAAGPHSPSHTPPAAQPKPVPLQARLRPHGHGSGARRRRGVLEAAIALMPPPNLPSATPPGANSHSSSTISSPPPLPGQARHAAHHGERVVVTMLIHIRHAPRIMHQLPSFHP